MHSILMQMKKLRSLGAFTKLTLVNMLCVIACPHPLSAQKSMSMQSIQPYTLLNV